MVASKRNHNKAINSAPIRLITPFKTYLEVKIKTTNHRWCKCKLHPSLTTSIRSKLSLWWMRREVCSITRTKSRGKSHPFFRRFHANLKVKPVFSVSEEITILHTLLSTKLMYSPLKCNHHQLTLAESSKPLQCITVSTWYLSIQRSLATKRSKQAKRRSLLQCSCKTPAQ